MKRLAPFIAIPCLAVVLSVYALSVYAFYIALDYAGVNKDLIHSVAARLGRADSIGVHSASTVELKVVNPKLGPENDAVRIGRFGVLELVFSAAESPANPFDTYLLKLEVTDPDGQVYLLDGFYDGDGNGGQTGTIWKARMSPDKPGTWSWRTVPGDMPDSALAGLSGEFECIESDDSGGVVAEGEHFRLQNDEPIYLVGNFLDLADGLRTTHTYMSETTTDGQRDAIIARQRDFHTSNKINVYFANRGDYGGQSVTPWLGTASNNDKRYMDLSRWRQYDGHIQHIKENQMLAQMWFFADDSGFGNLSEADRNRLLRYAMARTSAFSHVLYVIALEWAEGFQKQAVTAMGNYIQKHNPWDRLLSVHNHTDWQFSGEDWTSFIATQAGNAAGPATVNQVAITKRAEETIPHMDEEFGFLRADSDTRLRNNLWANFCGGAAGGGTGSDLRALQRFLAQSRIPFQRMAPANELVDGGGSTRFVLAEAGHHYVIYSTAGAFQLHVSGSGLQGRWLNPRDTNATLGTAFAVAAGTQTFTPPQDVAQDWVLWITDGSNLTNGVTHLTGDSTVTQMNISSESPTETPTPADTSTPEPTQTPEPTATPEPSTTPPSTVETPPAGDGIVTNLIVSTGKAYELDNLAIDKLVYIDRNYRFVSVPEHLKGAQYIHTANDDKGNKAPNHLRFTLTQPATVYIAYDERASSLPAWLDDNWTNTGESLGTTNVSARLYARHFGAGEVVLGGNAVAPMAGAASNYVVVIVPDKVDEPAATPTPTPTNTPEPTAATEVHVGYADAIADGEVDIRIEVIDVDAGQQLSAIELDLNYDPAVVTPVECVDESNNGFDVMICDIDTTGKVRLNAVSTAGVSHDQPLVRISFRALGQPGEHSLLDLHILTFADIHGNPLPVHNQDGGIAVTQVRLGDVSCDAAVDVVDGLYILQFNVGLKQAADQCPLPADTLLLATCDVNGDASCNAIDALFVLQCSVGMSNTLCPIAGASVDVREDVQTLLPPPITVTDEPANVQPGDAITLSVTGNVSADGVGAATFDVRYDPAVLEPVACAPDPAEVFDQALCNLAYEDDSVTPDIVRFSLVAVTGASGDLSMADVTFRVTGQTDLTGAVQVAPVVWADQQGQTIPVDEQSIQAGITGPDGSIPNFGQIFLPTIQR